jgi:hypothetical protein
VFAALPGRRHGFDELPDISLQHIIKHAKAANGIKQLVVQKKATGRKRKLGT